MRLAVVAAEANIQDLLARLAEALPGRGITYRICPLTSCGSVG